MEKYQSFHFSPLNNRSMLMPRIPKGTEYHVGSSRLVNPFEPISGGSTEWEELHIAC